MSFLSVKNLQAREELIALAKIAIPAVLAEIAQIAMGITDAIVAGRLDKQALAGVGLALDIYHPTMFLFFGVFIALNPIVANYYGRGNLTKIRTAFHSGILFTIPLALILFLILKSSAHWGKEMVEGFFQLLSPVLGTAPQELNESLFLIASDYLSTLAWMSWPLLLYSVFSAFNQGLHLTLPVMLVAFLALPLNLLLDVWFVWGGLGLPGLGVQGVAYATVLVQVVLALSLFAIICSWKPYKPLALLKEFSLPSKRFVKSFFALGIPIAVGIWLEVFFFSLTGLLVAVYDTTVAAAHQIVLKLSTFFFVIPLGISFAISARVGYQGGRNSIQGVRQAALIGLRVCFVVEGITLIFLLLFREQLASLFTQDVEVRALAMSLLLLAALSHFSDGVQIASQGVLKGFKDTIPILVVNIIAYFGVSLPLGFVLAEKYGWQAKGYWVGIIVGLILAAFLLLYRVFWQLSSKRLPTLLEKMAQDHD